MGTFKYKGKNRYGVLVDGERRGRSEKEVRQTLTREQIQVHSLEKKGGAALLSFSKGRTGKVAMRELAVFNRQLSVMFNAGLPLTQGLSILSYKHKNKYFSRVLLDVRREIEAGSNMSSSLKKHPKVFSALYYSMIQAGEASGNLDTVLLRLSQYIENINRLIGKVRSAMAYPVAVFVIAILMTLFMLWKVVPVFASLFIDMGAILPAPTQMLVNMSNFIQGKFFFIILGFFGLIYAFKAFNRTYRGRRVVDRIKLNLWVFGPLVSKVGVARITRTLSTLLNSGVEIIDALTITARTAGNAVLEDAVLRSRNSVQEGKPLNESWIEAKIFPFMVTQMVMVGEQTGALSDMLEKIADFYDEEVEQAVEALISMLEPLMIVFLGGLVGGIIISMYLPIFELISQF